MATTRMGLIGVPRVPYGFVANVIITGTGDLVVSTIALSGAGSVAAAGQIVGSGQLIVPSPLLSSAGSVVATITGTADLNVPSLTLTSDGNILATITGTGDLVVNVPILDSNGEAYAEVSLTVMVKEIWQLLGLDKTNPTTTTQTTADVDTIHQDITGDGVNTSTITRTT